MSKVGRNDPCPCESGKKYKKCCGASAAGPVRLPSANRVVFSAALWERAQTLYRAVLPARWLGGPGRGVEAVLVSGIAQAPPALLEAPARAWHFAPFGTWEWPQMAALQRRGVPCYIGFDDNYWAQREYAGDDPGTADVTGGLPDFERMITRCDGLIVTTPPVADLARRFNRNVHVVPNALPPLHELPSPRDPRLVGHLLRIGWTGSSGYKPDVEMVAPALLRILAAYPHVRVVFQGDAAEGFRGHPQVEILGWVPMAVYFQHLAGLALDIFMTPMRHNVFNACRSNLKALTAGAFGLAFVASDVGEFARTVQHGVTGLLVENTEDAWYEALRTLIEEPALRRELGENGRRWVAESGTIETTGPLWAKALGVSLLRKGLDPLAQ